MNEPTPEQVLSIIQNKDANFRDTKDMILFYHLHIEHYVNEIICHYAKKELHETLMENLTFQSKIGFLKTQKFIEDDIYRALLSINRIRNFMSHRLIMSPDEVWAKLDALSFSYVTPFKIPGYDPVDLGKEYKRTGFNKLDQFQTSAAILIGILYMLLKMVKGEGIDQLFYPKFSEKDGKPICWIQLLKNNERVGQEPTSSSEEKKEASQG